MSGNIADRARELVAPLALGMGLEVVEVKFAKENAEWYLRVYIDKRGGVRIDDCEQLSKAFSDILDGEDMIDRAYNLEVSSPGLDRPLKTEADFRRYEGELLEIRMLPGKAKAYLNEEPPALPGTGDTPRTGTAADSPASNKKSGAKNKKMKYNAGNPDMIVGILVKFEGDRIYLTDERENAFSLAWRDIKIVKRAVRF